MTISKLLYILKEYMCLFWYTTVAKIKCVLFNIQLGSGSKFYGRVHFYKNKNTSIKIGSSAVFRSYSNSNLIGINRNCSFSTVKIGAQIVVGNNCGFSGTVIGAFEKIELGNNVMCGANTLITDSDWHNDDPRSGGIKPVRIGNNVWLGEGVKVLKGVSIGENSVIGAGSVVVSDIPSNVIAAGNPCKVIKELKPLS